MRRPARALRDHTGGASAVEFAIVAAPLLLILFGTVEFGRLLWTRQAMQSLAISAARCMGVRQTSCSSAGAYSATATTSYVIAGAAGLGVPLASTNITLNASTTCGGVSGFSSVAISYTFATAVPVLINALAGGVALSASACFPNQPT